jgi:leader peptidase (prepilin peptidase)/N-methyltransferase
VIVPLFIIILGLIFGSFFNVCIFRLGEEEPLWKGRSRCRSCHKQIPWALNIPVWSFIGLRGKSRCCGQPISYQYPLVEIATAALYLGLYFLFGLNEQWFVYSLFCSWLLILSVIDLRLQIIPDELSLSGIPLGFGATFLTGDITWWSSLLGIVVGGGSFFLVAFLYEKFSGQEGLGGGDVKLLAMLGAWLGLESILILIVLSTFLGSLVGLFLIARGKATTKAAIPFGPFLAGSALIYLCAKQSLLEYFYPFYS